MAVQIYNLTFNATPAQFATMCATTLPAAGFAVIQAPIAFQGIAMLNSITFTGTVTISTATITAPSSTVGLSIGQVITDTTTPANIPAGTTLTQITPTLTMSANAVATGAGNTLVATGNPQQIDFSYDGAYFVRFYGSNPVLAADDSTVGLTTNQMTSSLVSFLTTTLAGTLGAPVPANQAVPPYNTNSI